MHKTTSHFKLSTMQGNIISVVLLTLALGAIVLGILAMNTRTALNMTEHHGEMIHAVMEIKYESTRFHLWLEELLSGDATLNKTRVWKHLDTAKKYSFALLNGGETEEGFVRPTASPSLRAHIEKTTDLLHRLGALAEQRLSMANESVAGKPIDEKFDALYEKIQGHAVLTERALRNIIDTQKREYKIFSFIMGAVIFAATFLYVYFIYQHERRRIKNTLQILAGETRICTVLNTVADSIVTTDKKGRIESHNPATTELFGYDSDELIGRKISLLLPALSNNQSIADTPDDFNPEKTHSLSRTFELKGERKNSSTFPADVTINEMWLEQSQLFTISVRDISRHKQAEQAQKQYSNDLEIQVNEQTTELRETLELAKKASYAKSEFLSRMSHELRTPMNAILGFGQLLELDAEGFNESQRENVTEILDAGHHLLNLINEVLDIARIESGKLAISTEKVFIHDVLQQCIALIKSQATEREIEIINNINDKQLAVLADFTRLKQVLLNLLSNAVKYNRSKGRIMLDNHIVENKRLRISVTDSGNGLTVKEIARLFTPFDRQDAINNVEGTGIGLVITKHLIELMGGTISVESAPGQGCVFSIELDIFHDA